MITLTNYASGELALANSEGQDLHLTRDQAHRLVMAARMHGTHDFINKIPNLISQPELAKVIATTFDGKNSSEQWNLKEKFARLQTITKEHTPEKPDEVVDVIEFQL